MIDTLLNQPLKEPKVVLFDMDGVLFDSMPLHAETWLRTAEHFGLEADLNEFYLFEGMKGYDTIEILYQRTHKSPPSKEVIEEIYRFKANRFKSLDSQTPLICGTHPLIEHLIGRGVKLGVVTGSTLDSALPRIEAYYPSFSRGYIVTADMVSQGKPHPEPYIKAAGLFEVAREEILVVENAPLGVRSARAAELFTVAVTTGPIPEYHLREEGANLIFPNMQALLVWWRCTFG